MLELDDFYHLPQLDSALSRLVGVGPGLIVVAGLDPRPEIAAQGAVDRDAFVPSGRSALFGILGRRFLPQNLGDRVWVIGESKNLARMPRSSRRWVQDILIKRPEEYAASVLEAYRQGANTIVLERLTPAALGPTFEAASHGVRVLTQLDTVFAGRHVAEQLASMGAPGDPLDVLTWVVTVQRVTTLCERCKQPDHLEPRRRADLQLRYPDVPVGAAFYLEGQCAECQRTGRKGDIAIFDVLQVAQAAGRPSAKPSVLPFDEYALGLAATGLLTLEDVLRLDAKRLHRAYRLLTSSEQALRDVNMQLTTKLAQLEAANRVLESRTGALLSLQKVSHALSTLADLDKLAASICEQARQLCGMERVILYLLRPDGLAEILAVTGWDPRLIHSQVDAHSVLVEAAPPTAGAGASPFPGWPPGIPERAADIEGAKLRQGLRVPLIAQNEVVGVLLFHSAKRSPIAPGEVALLQTFADQAAVAVQRAGLVEALRDKVERLEVAQVGLAKKERLERELELARQVQQSMLPRVFPNVPGYDFAARCEPARRVGGDFYDVFPLEGGLLGIVIADVSDKGMPAALFMALTRSLLLAEAQREPSPRLVLTRVHRLLRELSQSDMYVTLFYGVLHCKERSLTFVRAGHERPLFLRGATAKTLPGRGTVLGLLDEKQLVLPERRLRLRPGDRLVLYTDGLLDSLSPEGEPFGPDRLSELVLAHVKEPLARMCDNILGGVASFQGRAEQYDDMTLLALEVAPQKSMTAE